MSDEDFEIWKRWFPGVRQRWLRVWFDVELGDGQPASGVTDPGLLAAWASNTRKRADVIAETATEVEIIELRVSAQSNAIGRLLQYALLWRQDPLLKKPLRLILVTNRRDNDVAELARLQSIDYIVVS